MKPKKMKSSPKKMKSKPKIKDIDQKPEEPAIGPRQPTPEEESESEQSSSHDEEQPVSAGIDLLRIDHLTEDSDVGDVNLNIPEQPVPTNKRAARLK